LKSLEKRASDDFPRTPHPLDKLHQLSETDGGIQTVTGLVKFDPRAAQHLVQQQLLKKTTLDSLFAHGLDGIPAFPVTAISLKLQYGTIQSNKLKKGRYYLLEAWPGPPDPPQAFPASQWKNWIWIDTVGAGQGMGKVLCGPADPDESTIQPDVTYGLHNFIHFRLTKDEAATINSRKTKEKRSEVNPGDYAVMLGMHATTREITRWTWQTFWWVPDADNPKLPSSKVIAAHRPAKLVGAPRHYALVPGYTMLLPSQPITGGVNAGESVYVYNPYIEARFAGEVLPASLNGMYKGKEVKNNVGVQTNCMSCHAMASYAPDRTALKGKLYCGTRYVDLEGPQFRGTLKTSFLWSIPRVASENK
jgi:hypothetical protein